MNKTPAAPILETMRLSDFSEVLSSDVNSATLYPVNTKVGLSPHRATVRMKSSTMMATKLARTARPDARPTPTGPPDAK
jgi:hypothetical protein